LHEDARLGTMGGINKFRDEILEGNTESFFVLHCDIVCSFPLLELHQFHTSHGKECTILGHKVHLQNHILLNIQKVAAEEAHKYGCLAVNETTHEVLHYAEKPETFVSDIINCGVYLFSSTIFNLIDHRMPTLEIPP
jgi:mannose-1-phosphate guanylyltransferase